MVDPLGTTGVRVAVTLLIVAGVVGFRLLVRRLRGTEFDDRSTRYLGLSAAVAVVTAAGLVAVVFLWNLDGPLVRSYRNLGLQDIAGRLLLAFVVLGATYALTGFVGEVIGTITGKRSSISEHQREIVHRITQVTLYGFALLVVIGLFTRDLGNLLIGAGFLGIVVGMAARQTLGSVLAGFVLMFSRPFEIGDWVAIGDRDGIVTEITVFNTRLQTFDGEYVMLPNDEVTGQPITNRTRKGRLRIEVEVGVDYDHDPEYAAGVARKAVRDLEEILDVPTPQVVGKRFGDSAIVLGVRVWIDDPSARRMWRARTAVIDAVTEAFADEGIDIPFPQRELSGRPETGGLAVRGAAERDAESPPTPEGDGR